MVKKLNPRKIKIKGIFSHKTRNDLACAGYQDALERAMERFHLHQLLDEELLKLLHTISVLERAIDRYKRRF